MRISPEVKEKARQLREEGASYSAIMKATGLSKSTVARIANPATLAKDRSRNKQYYWSDPEACKAKKREWAKNNPEKVAAYSREYYDANQKDLIRKASVWRENNPDKALASLLSWQAAGRKRQKENPEIKREYQARYSRKYPEKLAENSRLGAAKRRQARPKWLTKKQRRACARYYAFSTAASEICGVRYHVDHIVPLTGKDVCGLHVPWNLRVILASANLSKGNKFDAGK